MNVVKRLQKNTSVEISGTIIIIALVMLFSFVVEKQYTIQNGITSDAVEYYRVAQNFNSHVDVIAMPPYVYRIGTPFLVSLLFANNLYLGFKIINVCSSCRCYFSFIILAAALFEELFCANNIDRFVRDPLVRDFKISLISPVNVDSIALVFNLIGFILVFYLQRQPENFRLLWAFGILTFIGVIFRELVIFLSLIYLIVHIHEIISGPAQGRH